jgi:predicted phage tail protein
MTEVMIHGALGLKYGRKHRFKIEKLSELTSAFEANFKNYRFEMLKLLDKGIDYKVIDPEKPDQNFKTLNEFMEAKAPEVIHVVPSIGGSGLVALAVQTVTSVIGAVGSSIFSLGATLGSGTFWGNLLVGMLFQGLISLLFKPKSDQKVKAKVDTASYVFSSLENNATQGFPVPLLYGELRVGSNIVGTNMINQDLNKPKTQGESELRFSSDGDNIFEIIRDYVLRERSNTSSLQEGNSEGILKFHNG